MVSPTVLIEPAARFLQLADAFGRYGTLIILIVGILGWWTRPYSQRRADRFRGMAFGGGIGHLAILSVDAVYGILGFILGGQFLPSKWPYGAISNADSLDTLLQLSIGISGILHYLGLSCFIVGITVWAAANRESRTGHRGRYMILLGIVLLGASIGGNLFGVFADVFI